jgi:hypothetical protein
MSITRRLFLRNTAAAGAVAATVTAPVVAAEPAPVVAVEPSIDEVIDRLQAELKAALARKFGEKNWQMWAVGPRGVHGPSVFFHTDSTDYLSGDQEGGAK